MADDAFEANLLRLVAAQLAFQNGLAASREMFGKSYFALGQHERLAVDQAVIGQVAANFQQLTPEFLAGQESRQQVGFLTPGVVQSAEKKS